MARHRSNSVEAQAPSVGDAGVIHCPAVAEQDPAIAATDTGADVARPDQAAAEPYPFDEQTLGRSASVFDAEVGLAPQPAMPMPPMAHMPVTPGPIETAAPISGTERRRRVRLQARKVRRVIRHIEPFSVLKVSVVFYLCLWLILMFAGLVLWSIAETSGTLETIEELVESLFQLNPENDFWQGGTLFRRYAQLGLILSFAGICFNVLLAVLYNLISDLMGGIRLTVIEEESARFRPPQRRR